MISLQTPIEMSSDRPCFDILPIIDSISGRFTKGFPEGRGTITYFDKCFTEGTFINGRPHGPFWVYSPDQEQVVLVHFDQGHLVPDNVVLLDHDAEWAMMGKLVNDSYLEDVRKIDVDWIGEYKCLTVLRLPKIDDSDEKIAKFRLPVKIIGVPSQARIIVRPSKMMYFNRVAKTGSQSFIALLHKLGAKHNFDVKVKIMQREQVVEEIPGVLAEVEPIFKNQEPNVFVRHYSFVDFDDLGYQWHPDWFNLVRDPIDKVNWINLVICVGAERAKRIPRLYLLLQEKKPYGRIKCRVFRILKLCRL
jgi:hypothetical protein